jgi:hypothetical protein
VIEAYLHDTFYYGLPATHCALAYYGVRSEVRRRKVMTLGTKGVESNGLPSWSWVGWEGKLALNAWALFSLDEYRQLPTEIITEACMAKESVFRVPGVDTAPCFGHAEHCPHLQLATPSFTIHPNNNVTFKTIAGAYDIFISFEYAGYLLTPENLEDKQSILPSHSDCGRAATPIQLVAISTCSYDFSTLEAQYLIRKRRDVLTKDIEVCNVLWVGWEGGIAYSKAITLIFLDVWESLNTENTTIILG